MPIAIQPSLKLRIANRFLGRKGRGICAKIIAWIPLLVLREQGLFSGTNNFCSMFFFGGCLLLINGSFCRSLNHSA